MAALTTANAAEALASDARLDICRRAGRNQRQLMDGESGD